MNSQSCVKADAELKNLLKACCEAVLKRFSVGYPCEISITFTDNEGIREINRDNREIDAATDVLSFPMNDMENGAFSGTPDTDENGALILGDIVISLEKAASQAEEYGHSFKREVAFLCVHSMLHLLGFDHMTPADEKQMFALQEKILTEMGITRN